MDIFTISTAELPEDFRDRLGRNTVETIRTKDHWMTLIPEAPHVFSGASGAVEVSPPLWLYCPGGYNNQVIGCCVGEGTKNAASTLLRIPENAVFDPVDPSKSSRPKPTIRLSALYCYLNARNIHGTPGFGEGAVVAYSLDAVRQYGVIPEALWPDTEANQKAYRDRAMPPPAAMLAEGLKHRVVHAARITSKSQYYDYLSQGYPVIDGVPVTDGWMRTAEDGQFSLDGSTVGGHATVTVGYDRRRNRLYKRNSWANWGAKTDDAEFNTSAPAFGGNAGGYSNIGYCDLDQYESFNLTDAAFGSGQTDAFVINTIPWGDNPTPKPKITLRSSMELL